MGEFERRVHLYHKFVRLETSIETMFSCKRMVEVSYQ